MPIYDEMARAMREKDIESYLALMHDDYEFVRHKDGSTLGRADAEKMLRNMMATGEWNVSDQRLIYENDDILVSHSKMSFPDGSREAVMSVAKKKDGKVIRLETGATPLN